MHSLPPSGSCEQKLRGTDYDELAANGGSVTRGVKSLEFIQPAWRSQ